MKRMLIHLIAAATLCSFSYGIHAADDFRPNLKADSCRHFDTTGVGKYYNLTPGFQTILDGVEEGKATHLVITITRKTKKVAGVMTRVLEERESVDGELKEISLNYLAVCRKTGDLCYFGEDVDNYENGKVANHGSAWLAGRKKARFGILIPGSPAPGQMYYQEQAPGVAMDRAEVVSVNETYEAPAGKFEGCMRTSETTPLEPGTAEPKVYARGIGLVQDGALKLTSSHQAK